MQQGGSPRTPSIIDTGSKPGAPEATDGREEVVLPLAAERIVVTRGTREATVRVSTSTIEREQHVDVPLAHRRVDVEHVPIGRVVDVVPPVREVDGVTIIPVVEEVVVIERRLVLKEEIHVRQVTVHERHVEDVVLRAQQVEVTRTELGIVPEGGVAPDSEDDQAMEKKQ